MARFISGPATPEVVVPSSGVKLSGDEVRSLERVCGNRLLPLISHPAPSLPSATTSLYSEFLHSKFISQLTNFKVTVLAI